MPRASSSKRSAAALESPETPLCVWFESAYMGNDLTKRLMSTGLLAGVGALSSIVANRVATKSGSGSLRNPPID